MRGARSALGTLVGGAAGPVRRASRYDLVLAVIPAAFLAAAGLGTASSVSVQTAVGAAAAVSGLAVLDALFINPPREPSGGQLPA